MSANENDLNLNQVAQPMATTTVAAPAPQTVDAAQVNAAPVNVAPVETSAPVESAPVAPVVTPETGQLDTRFALWRDFCAQEGVDVETLPSELKGNLKDSWEAMKDEQLTPVRDEVTNTPVTTQS